MLDIWLILFFTFDALKKEGQKLKNKRVIKGGQFGHLQILVWKKKEQIVLNLISVN